VIGYVLPPILLSASDLSEFRIVSGYVDQSEIRIGPFLTARLTGQILVEGYDLVEEVQLEFRSASNFTIALAIEGTDGIYNINLIPSISGGEYELYATADGLYGESVELHIGSLLVIEDNSIVVLMAIVAIAVIIVSYNVPKLITRFRGDDST
jgi:hypothetical protein